MEAPSKRMRLTVVVEALAEENAHGDYRDIALAAFKERRFAMPVQLDVTFEAVWADIEQRYKTNYLDPQQAATFSIKKLQDAYDCDLDMTDTVGDIFEGEADARMRMIKVIPHFIYRDTSVVPGSMLRPNGAQKRGGDDVEDGANKRRRVASQQRQRQRQSTYGVRDLSPNQPILSTESQQAAAAGPDGAEAARRSTRSRTGASLVELRRNETGQAPFSTTAVKQEQEQEQEGPEPERPSHLNGSEAASPDELTTRPVESTTEQRPHDDRPSRDRIRTSREGSQDALSQPVDEEVPELEKTTGDELAAAPQQPGSQQRDPREAAIQQSPLSSVDPEAEPAPATRQRIDIYRVPDSPDFMHRTATPDKPGRTYGRSPKTASDLLNTARGYECFAENGTPASTANARAAPRPLADGLQSTPQDAATPATRSKSNPSGNDAGAGDDDADLTASFLNEAAAPNHPQTPARKSVLKPAKPGSLKKPSRTSLMSTPASTKRAASSKAAATPAKTPARLPLSSGKPSSARSAASQSAVGTTKGKQAAIFKTPARKTATPQSTQTPAGTPQEKPYECPTCQARFSREDNLKRHIKTHTDERTHVCFKCGRKYTRPDLLNRHQRSEDGCAGRHSSFDTEGMDDNRTDALNDAHVQKDKGTDSERDRHEKITSYLTTDPDANTQPDDGPLKSDGHRLRRGRSSGSSLLTTGVPDPSKSSHSAGIKSSANPRSPSPNFTPRSNENAKPTNGIIEITSAESSSSDSSDPDGEPEKHTEVDMDIARDTEASSDKGRSQRMSGTTDVANDQGVQPKEARPEHEEVAVHIVETPSQDKPPSGQEAAGGAHWGPQSWSFGRLDHKDNTNNESHQYQAPTPAAAVATPVTEDEGFAEQDPYTTALEDNAARSRSASAAASLRSSPAVSRRPARFLSHSPTPDASESEDDIDEAAAAKIPSPHVNNREGSESDSDSSSDSSDDEDADMPDLSIGQANAAADTQVYLPSSPPIGGDATLTPSVPHSNHSAPSQARRPSQRTPILPPTVQSSQAPRSSQSVSVQAVDRRRYTGFRSLREQLADTKAAQATTQKKPFDPRTMSLGKLMKSTPLSGLGGDNESSDDESSSSSSSDSD
ncbi:hypothetical protein E8E12_011624 [Didymella heteroderae]|uniref:C2H2-type domain-containing protein n=1 Tax=Didymella heteroderae TaxID=1769908 RepID=A0A9P5C583_9PLEO|nr:hypothetical protein E8E12_011624 [Didymella heteroderae]